MRNGADAKTRMGVERQAWRVTARMGADVLGKAGKDRMGGVRRGVERTGMACM